MLDVVETQAREQGRLGVAFGDDQPAFRATAEQILDEGVLKVFGVPLSTIVELESTSPPPPVLNSEWC